MTELSVDLRPGARAPLEARRAVTAAFPEPRVPTGDVLPLLVSELVTNSVLHAMPGPQDRIALRAAMERGTLRVEVSDPSPRVARRRPASPGSGGYGLNLVQSLSDRWGAEMRDGYHVTWFEIEVP